MPPGKSIQIGIVFGNGHQIIHCDTVLMIVWRPVGAIQLCKMTWKKLSTQEDFLSISAKVIDFVLA
jgi:hypothetical protein